jgi:hypothetical protein
MEKSWWDARVLVYKHHPQLVSDFDFNLMDDVNLIVNNYTRRSFPHAHAWHSPQLLWQRAGVGVWDFLLRHPAVPLPQRGDTLTLVKTVRGTTLLITCRVREVHMQTKEEILDFGTSHSAVCGRAVLTFLRVAFPV